MATFLELGQDLIQEAGIAGNLVSVTGNIGELNRVVRWILRAYKDIQRRNAQWEFLRRDLSFPTIADVSTYTAASANVASFGEWRPTSFRVYSAAIGIYDEQQLVYVPWNTFRDTFLVGAQRDMRSRPTHITQRPDQSLQVWPLPDGVYQIIGEYYLAPQSMAANADVPIFPAKFHDAITWRALMYYAQSEAAPELYAAGQEEFLKILDQMNALQMEEVTIAEAFA